MKLSLALLLGPEKEGFLFFPILHQFLLLKKERTRWKQQPFLRYHGLCALQVFFYGYLPTSKR